MAAASTDALQAYRKLQNDTCEHKLAQAMDMAHACVLSKLHIRPDIIEDLVRFSDTYTDVLNNAVRALGGTGVEIIATFPEGKVKIDKYSR